MIQRWGSYYEWLPVSVKTEEGCHSQKLSLGLLRREPPYVLSVGHEMARSEGPWKSMESFRLWRRTRGSKPIYGCASPGP